MLSELFIIISHLMVTYLVIVQPVLGPRNYQRLLKRVATKSDARVRYYLTLMSVEWLVVLVILLIAFVESVALTAFGLRLPFSLFRIDMTTSLLLTLFCLGFISISMVASIYIIQQRIGTSRASRIRRSLLKLAGLLPHTRSELRIWLFLSLTTGICEEIAYRGFLPWYLLQFDRQIPIWLALILSSLIFGLAHTYQGWQSVLRLSIIGGMFALLYIITGSLLIPIVFHTLLNLRTGVLAYTLFQRHADIKVGDKHPDVDAASA